jgi:hypothetical protein
LFLIQGMHAWEWRGIRARQSFFTRPPHGFGFTETEEAPTMEASDRADN